MCVCVCRMGIGGWRRRNQDGKKKKQHDGWRKAAAVFNQRCSPIGSSRDGRDLYPRRLTGWTTDWITPPTPWKRVDGRDGPRRAIPPQDARARARAFNFDIRTDGRIIGHTDGEYIKRLSIPSTSCRCPPKPNGFQYPVGHLKNPARFPRRLQTSNWKMSVQQPGKVAGGDEDKTANHNDCRVRITKDIGSLYYSGKFFYTFTNTKKKILFKKINLIYPLLISKHWLFENW